MSFENPINSDREKILERCEVEVLHPDASSWEKFGEGVLNVEASAFSEKNRLPKELIEAHLTDPENTLVALKDRETGEIVGFTYAKPSVTTYPEDFPDRQAAKDTAYIYDTALRPAYQGKGLLPPLMRKLEEELARKGFAFIERDAANYIENEEQTEEPGKRKETYADKIRKAYGDRILKEEKHDSEYGPQVFFRIRLEAPEQKIDTNKYFRYLKS